jgi:hypothetical protein
MIKCNISKLEEKHHKIHMVKFIKNLFSRKRKETPEKKTQFPSISRTSYASNSQSTDNSITTTLDNMMLISAIDSSNESHRSVESAPVQEIDTTYHHSSHSYSAPADTTHYTPSYDSTSTYHSSSHDSSSSSYDSSSSSFDSSSSSDSGSSW